MAGINAVRKLDGKESFVLDRSEAYIGVLIDDLVTKGTNEPYRIMTSRAEYRLVLRQDNADMRLTEKGWNIGLVTEERYRRFQEKKRIVEAETERLRKRIMKPDEINPILSEKGSAPISNPAPLIELLRRPEISYDSTEPVDRERPKLSSHQKNMMEVQIKYEGYIEKQRQQIEKFRRMENRKLPEDLDYGSIEGLRIEARQKLDKIRPLSLGQASRISGVSPADINVLLIYMEKQRRAGNGRE